MTQEDANNIMNALCNVKYYNIKIIIFSLYVSAFLHYKIYFTVYMIVRSS